MLINILYLPGHGVGLTGWKVLQFEFPEFSWNFKQKIPYFSVLLAMFKEIYNLTVARHDLTSANKASLIDQHCGKQQRGLDQVSCGLPTNKDFIKSG